MTAPADERERWELADGWATFCHGPRGGRILEVGAEGFRWDAEGSFAPQWRTWDQARADLHERDAGVRLLGMMNGGVRPGE